MTVGESSPRGYFQGVPFFGFLSSLLRGSAGGGVRVVLGRETQAFRGDLGPEPAGSGGHYLFLLDDADPGLDVGEGMPGGQHGVPPVLLPQLPPGPALQGEGGGVHEPPQVEILLEVRYPVFHLVLIKVGLHKRDLYVGLRGRGGGKRRWARLQAAPRRHWGGRLGHGTLLRPCVRPKATEAERVGPDVSPPCSAPPGRPRAVGEEDRAACPWDIRSPSCPSKLT